ncbi:hypothetical protein ATCC90586_003438 [Pythium insidiosum]|nr:hypothetical protein ATCC90586_003438 [Pythium insidiosum]
MMHLRSPAATKRSTPTRSTPVRRHGSRKTTPVKQVSIESFLGSEQGRVEEDVQFKVPFLPLSAPTTETPAAFNDGLPLYAHQQRSLYRMLQIEARDEHVSRFNFGKLDYYSKGGCLADAIGTGKTATMLALIVSEPINATLGANLLLAPSHLLAQWKAEVDKFIRPGEIDVVLGLRRYLAMDPRDISNRTLVLVGVDEVISSQSFHFHRGRLYPREVGHAGTPLESVDVDAMAEYTAAARYVSNAYSGPVWVTKVHLPVKPWRRVVFEEVQDLVLPGKASQDCFIQLTRRCEHVWLITATPFPAKAESIYANNQLLGFKRLRLLPHDPAFDEIKRKLYLRNCAQVKQDAITDKIRVTQTYISVALHPHEHLLCRIEKVLAGSTDALASSIKDAFQDTGGVPDEEANGHSARKTSGKKRAAAAPLPSPTPASSDWGSPFWGERFTSARQSCVHVGVSDRILERDHPQLKSPPVNSAAALAAALIPIKIPREIYRDELYALDREISVANMRKREVDVMEAATRNTVAILRVLLNQVYWSVEESFADMESSGLRSFFSSGRGEETPAGFRVLSRHGRWANHAPPEPLDLLLYHRDEIEGYLGKYWSSKAELTRFCSIMETTLQERCPRARQLVEDQLNALNECRVLREELEGRGSASQTTAALTERDRRRQQREQRQLDDAWAEEDEEEQEMTRSRDETDGHANPTTPVTTFPPRYGSKITQLVTYLLRQPSHVQVVVFTMWKRALRVVEQALTKSGISCAVFLEHQSSETKSAHVQSFVRGETKVLLLHALTSASGINLQVAAQVIFLDPVGFDPVQASALEAQAIGRVLRMGQTHTEVAVVRFVAEHTLEATLYDEVHAAAQRASADEDQFFDGANGEYVCADFAAPLRRVIRMEVRPDRVSTATTAAAPADEEIAMVGAMSLEQIINQRVESAAAQGEVFDLTEDADESLHAQLERARQAEQQRQSRKRIRSSPEEAAPSWSSLQAAYHHQVTVKQERSHVPSGEDA